MLYHYYHFMVENVLGGFAALVASERNTGREAHAETGTRLIIPWQGDWADGRGLNRAVIDGLFDGGFLDDQEWRRMDEDEQSWICFERREPRSTFRGGNQLTTSRDGRPGGVTSA
jgi:hypothetical protein